MSYTWDFISWYRPTRNSLIVPCSFTGIYALLLRCWRRLLPSMNVQTNRFLVSLNLRFMDVSTWALPRVRASACMHLYACVLFGLWVCCCYLGPNITILLVHDLNRTFCFYVTLWLLWQYKITAINPCGTVFMLWGVGWDCHTLSAVRPAYIQIFGFKTLQSLMTMLLNSTLQRVFLPKALILILPQAP